MNKQRHSTIYNSERKIIKNIKIIKNLPIVKEYFSKEFVADNDEIYI